MKAEDKDGDGFGEFETVHHIFRGGYGGSGQERE
jgi:hypothetical protein